MTLRALWRRDVKLARPDCEQSARLLRRDRRRGLLGGGRRQCRLCAGILGICVRPRRLRRGLLGPLPGCRRFRRRSRLAFSPGGRLQRLCRLGQAGLWRIQGETRQRRCRYACTCHHHERSDRETGPEHMRIRQDHGVHRRFICGDNGCAGAKVPAQKRRYSLVLESQVALRTPGCASSLTSTASSSFGCTAVETSVATISRCVSLSSFTSTSPTG